MTPDAGQIIYYVLLGVAALAAAIYAGRKHPSASWHWLVEEQQKQLSELAKTVDDHGLAISTLRIQLADKEIEIHQLQGEKAALELRAATLEARVTSLEAENAQLKKRLENEQRRRRELAAKFEAGNGGA